MKRHVVGLVVSSLLLLSCAKPPDSPTPVKRRSVLGPPSSDAGPPALSVRERVDRALAKGEPPRWVRAELVVTPELSFPLKPNPSGFPNDEVWPTRMLLDGGTEELEPWWIASGIAAHCFAASVAEGSSPHASATFDLYAPEFAILRRDKTPLGTCLISEITSRPYQQIAYRIAATFSVQIVSGTGATSAEEARGDIDELEHRPVTAPVLVLLGARHIDAALFDRVRRDDHEKAARAAFEKVIADAGGGKERMHALLGLALTAPEKGSYAWRAILCPSRFSYPARTPVPQDRSRRYWEEWARVHPEPISHARRNPKKTGVATPLADGPKTWDEETKYRSPYEGCVAPPELPPEIVAEGWRRIAAWDAHDEVGAGPFALSRAITAQKLALAAQPKDIHAKLALIRFHLRRQDFIAARVDLRDLLKEIEAQADPELQLRAAQLYGSALTYDMVGGDLSDDEPFVERPQTYDRFPQPGVVSKRMTHMSLMALEDPSNVPPAAKWAPPVWRAAAIDLAAVAVYPASVEIAGKFLERFPLHRDAPLVQAEQIAYLSMVGWSFKPGTADATAAAKVVEEAKKKMTAYVGQTPWTEANKGDAEAIARAEKLAAQK